MAALSALFLFLWLRDRALLNCFGETSSPVFLPAVVPKPSITASLPPRLLSQSLAGRGEVNPGLLVVLQMLAVLLLACRNGFFPD